jgi:hypothetical protein
MSDFKFFTVEEKPDFVFLDIDLVVDDSLIALKKSNIEQRKYDLVFAVNFRGRQYLNTLKQTPVPPNDVLKELGWPPIILLTFLANTLQYDEHYYALENLNVVPQ